MNVKRIALWLTGIGALTATFGLGEQRASAQPSIQFAQGALQEVFGQTFVVNITGANLSALGGGINLRFDPVYLRIVGVAFDQTVWAITSGGTIDNSLGTAKNLSFANDWAPFSPPVPIPIAAVTFQSIGFSGTTVLELSEVAASFYSSPESSEPYHPLFGTAIVTIEGGPPRPPAYPPTTERTVLSCSGVAASAGAANFTIVRNSASSNCGDPADIFASGTIPLNTGDACCTPAKVAALANAFNTPTGNFPQIGDSCVDGKLSIQRFPYDSRGNWDVCINGTKVAGRSTTSVAPDGGPIFVPGSVNVNGITITGLSELTPAVPALSPGGLILLGGLMASGAAFLILRKCRPSKRCRVG